MSPGAYEVESPIGIDVHAVIGLIIQREGERQADKRRAVIGVITGIRRSWHDRVGSRSNRVLAWRTTLDCVIACKGRITIASFSSDRSGTNGRRRAPTKIEMHRERGRVSVHLDVSDAPTSITSQRQIGC
jgi:hypothetical protein